MEQFMMNLEFTSIVWAFVLPFILMILDVITGYINAWRKNEVDSSKMRDGLGKKCAELVYIVLGVLLKLAFRLDVIMYGIILYICYMELNSIAENCDKLGFKIASGKINEKLNNKKEGE